MLWRRQSVILVKISKWIHKCWTLCVSLLHDLPLILSVINVIIRRFRISKYWTLVSYCALKKICVSVVVICWKSNFILPFANYLTFEHTLEYFILILSVSDYFNALDIWADWNWLFRLLFLFLLQLLFLLGRNIEILLSPWPLDKWNSASFSFRIYLELLNEFTKHLLLFLSVRLL